MSESSLPPEELERRLKHVSRLAGVGKVASGAAHEINQPLNVIRMAAFNIKRAVQKGRLEPQAALDKLARIDEQIDRAARLVGGMKSFSPTSQSLRTILHPSDSIAVALELMAKRFSAAPAEVEHVAAEQTCDLSADPTSIQELVFNIIDNAIEAFANQPEPERQEGEPLPPKVVKITEQLEGETFIFTVEDNAGGVDPAIINQIFEPFFSTCEDGTRAGLGLAVARDIVEDLEGSIAITNGEAGAIVTVRLPVTLSLVEQS